MKIKEIRIREWKVTIMNDRKNKNGRRILESFLSNYLNIFLKEKARIDRLKEKER